MDWSVILSTTPRRFPYHALVHHARVYMMVLTRDDKASQVPNPVPRPGDRGMRVHVCDSKIM